MCEILGMKVQRELGRIIRYMINDDDFWEGQNFSGVEIKNIGFRQGCRGGYTGYNLCLVVHLLIYSNSIYYTVVEYNIYFYISPKNEIFEPLQKW